MKQTAVEWLMPKILGLNLQLSLRKISARNCELEIAKLFQQAKEMEKEQIIDAYDNSYIDRYYHNGKNGVQYYKETFKNK